MIEAKIGVKYDENALARRIESLKYLKEENQVASVDAHPEFQNTEFVVVPEVIGTQIDTETFNKDIRESIEGFQDTFESDRYELLYQTEIFIRFPGSSGSKGYHERLVLERMLHMTLIRIQKW